LSLKINNKKKINGSMKTYKIKRINIDLIHIFPNYGDYFR
jgi:hypothetical protein